MTNNPYFNGDQVQQNWARRNPNPLVHASVEMGLTSELSASYIQDQTYDRKLTTNLSKSVKQTLAEVP